MSKIRHVILLLFVTLSGLSARLTYDTQGLASKYGHPAEEYKVITDDGYILGIFHLPGHRGLPVLLMHGLIDSSDTWFLRGNNSLAITLANLGFDVWLGNCRGNIYSRKHVYIDADRDASIYWDFSFHDHGYYDLPATIDFVLDKTGAKKLNAIGHSQGTTMFYVMGSLKQDYNEKVNLLIGLAPVAFLKNMEPPISLLIDFAPQLFNLSRNLKQYQIFGNSPIGRAYKSTCSQPIIGYPLCAFAFIFPVAGYDFKEYGYNFHYKVSQYFPKSTSLKNLYHYAQLIRNGKFTQFDYGDRENLKIYESTEAPDYDLLRVKMPVALLCGRNDKLATVKDAELLKQGLPNVVQYTVLDRVEMNHLDFVWGKNMKKYLFPHIHDILKRFLY